MTAAERALCGLVLKEVAGTIHLERRRRVRKYEGVGVGVVVSGRGQTEHHEAAYAGGR